MRQRAIFMAARQSPISYVTSVNGGALSAGSTSVTVPAHAVGDLLIAFGASQNSIPATPAGWTSLATVSNAGGLYGRAVYKTGSGNSETATFTSAGGNSAGAWSSAIVLRGVTGIGAVAVTQNNFTTSQSVTLPALTLQDTSGQSAVLCAHAVSPLTEAGGEMRLLNGLGLLRGPTSWPALTASIAPYTARPIGYAIELRGAALPVCGQAVFTASGTWVPPPGVTSFCAVAVQSGGAQGEANASKITVGGTVVLRALNGSRVGQGGGDGGLGGASLLASIGSSGGYPGGGTDTDYGGGGAAGYAGNGGRGGRNGQGIAPTAGAGGGGGGGDSDGTSPSSGGGVGLYGQGASGAAGYYSGGADGSPPAPFFGVGLGAAFGGDGRGGALAWANDIACTPGVGVAVQAINGGAVRIIWGGGRSFPFNAGDA